MIKAVIFDMDGLIVDSEPLQSKAFEETIRSYGKEPILNENGLVHKVGIRGDINWPEIMERHGFTDDMDKVREKRRKIYIDFLKDPKNIKAMPGLYELLAFLKQEKIKLGVCSSSSLPHVLLTLEGLKVKEYFDVIMSGQDYEKSKPDPEGFLKTAQLLGVKPEDCLVLEDAQSGVEAAHRAGMRCFAVPNIYTKGHDFSKAEKVLNSLLHVPPLLNE